MKTLAILSRKGGTGKTTLAIHLSVAATLAGHVVALIDLDPQASACEWSDVRDKNAPAVISAQEARLPEVLHKAEQHGVTLAILDTSPKSDILDTAEASDFCLIPCKSAFFEVKAIRSTVKGVKMAGVPSAIVFNAVRYNCSKLMSAKKGVKKYNIEIAPIEIRNRVAFSDPLIDGETAQEFGSDEKAITEINALYRFIAKRMEL